jgi:hypothetical protein
MGFFETLRRLFSERSHGAEESTSAAAEGTSASATSPLQPDEPGAVGDPTATGLPEVEPSNEPSERA